MLGKCIKIMSMSFSKIFICSYLTIYNIYWNIQGLSQYNYFNSAISLIKKYGTPASVTAAVGSTISASSLRNDFGGASKVALQCTSGSYLVGAYTCWTKTSSGTPGSQTTCPADVQKEDSCTASTLTVQSFP